MPSLQPRASSCDSYSILVTRHHEVFENAKFHGASRPNRPSHFLPSQLLAHNYTLLPITFDPGGQLGPLATAFLSANQNNALSALPYRSDDHCDTGLTSVPSKHLHRQLHSLLPFSLFQRTDSLWRQSSPSHPFTRHYSASTPSQWAIQCLSQNMLIALASHFNTARSLANPLHSNAPSWLSCALYQPASATPNPSLPSPYSCRLPIIVNQSSASPSSSSSSSSQESH